MNYLSRFAGLLLVVLPSGFMGYAQQKPTIERAPVVPTNPSSGSEMYRAHCAVCHGLDGKGDGPAAPALKQTPPDLTVLAKKNGGTFPVFQTANVITGYTAYAAHGIREMPIWGDVYGRDDEIVKLRVQNLVDYLRSLQQK